MEQEKLIKLDAPFYPFISTGAIDYFEKILKPEFVACEYGSGAGTIWLAQRIQEVVSIEHSQPWFNTVRQKLDDLGLEVDLRLISPEKEGKDGKESKESFNVAAKAYTTFVQQYPDEWFDLVFLDGWRPSRPKTPSLAIPKVKPLGWIVVDNLEWPPVRDGVRAAGLDGWKVAQFSGPAVGYVPGLSTGPLICHTGFYQKPPK